eukprot:CAMPEP_0170584180 /NCGR_PEP_ID=MMETSP0224-20130122/8550_1 /TAXON_ID=285029 /ORGANISM="Togula jolla, Strain CCCM 725" /LENGTH=120 /DNA_ID=CAMNT_0010907595 /DNA_START=700 /DNA_END=1062 /DNA_ORIENTATION=+
MPGQVQKVVPAPEAEFVDDMYKSLLGTTRRNAPEHQRRGRLSGVEGPVGPVISGHGSFDISDSMPYLGLTLLSRLKQGQPAGESPGAAETRLRHIWRKRAQIIPVRVMNFMLHHTTTGKA